MNIIPKRTRFLEDKFAGGNKTQLGFGCNTTSNLTELLKSWQIRGKENPSGKSRKQSSEGELTPAFRIGTVAGQAQIPDKILWEIAGSVGNVASFNRASSQLLKAWGIVGQVTDKPNHQWVPTQAQLFQVNQVKDLSRKVSQQVIVQAKRTQGVQPEDGDANPVKMCKQNHSTIALHRDLITLPSPTDFFFFGFSSL